MNGWSSILRLLAAAQKSQETAASQARSHCSHAGTFNPQAATTAWGVGLSQRRFAWVYGTDAVGAFADGGCPRHQRRLLAALPKGTKRPFRVRMAHPWLGSPRARLESLLGVGAGKFEPPFEHALDGLRRGGLRELLEELRRILEEFE
jgi:hypothetical protein